MQPLIEPLFEGRSPIEVLSLIVDEKPRTGYDIVRETVKSLVGNSFTEYRWKKLLAEGVIDGTEWKPAADREAGRRQRDPKHASGRAVAGQGRIRTGLLHRQSLRRPLRQQRLAAGTARSDDAAHLGQRRGDEREDGPGDRRQAGRTGRTDGGRAPRSWPRSSSCPAWPKA